MFAQLSEFFKDPTEEFAGDMASGRLFEYFQTVFNRVGIKEISLLEGLKVEGDALTVIKNDYRKLFFGPLPPYIVPVESVYKKWSNDPECKLTIAGEKGCFMGDPAIDMIKRYQADGVIIPDKYSSMPDHIALELEYMSFLFMNGDKERQKGFLDSHLDWIDQLKHDIGNFKESGKFYAAGAEITALIISNLVQNLNNKTEELTA